MGIFNSEDHYIYYCGKEFLRRIEIALIVKKKKKVQNAVLGCNLKNDRMISVHFQCKPFNITVIQVYAPTSNTKEAEVEQFYEELRPRTNTKKRCHCHHRGLECKSRSQEKPGGTGKAGLGARNEAGQRLTELCQETVLITANPLPATQETTLHVDITRCSISKSD